MFWRHLSDANLVDGQFGTTGNSLVLVNTGKLTGIVTNVSQSIPQAKIGRGIGVTVMSGAGTNHFALLPITNITAAGVYTMGTQGLTPTEAQNIDTKIDDGQPETGIVLALGLAVPVAGIVVAGSPAQEIAGAIMLPSNGGGAGNCVIGSGVAATDTYNLIPTTGGTDPSCGLSVRFQ